MSDLTKLNIRVNPTPSMPLVKPITLKEMITWIESLELSDYVKKTLVKDVSQYPENSYRFFKKTLNSRIAKINKNKESKNEEKDS